jgi:ADP-heptose:LPS heptosyltransferase
VQDEALEFPLRDDDRAALEVVAETHALAAGHYVCVHPGATDPARRWPPERFAAVANGLAARGFRIVLTGTADESHLTRAVARRMTGPSLDLAGRTSVGAMAVLLSHAALLVSNDTGVSHLAAALDVPSVVVFISSNPGRWAPLDRQRHRVVGRPGTESLAARDGVEGPEAPGPRIATRCLRDGCFTSWGSLALQPVPATVEAVLAQAEALLAEVGHAF